MALIRIKRIKATRIIHRKTVSSRKKMTGGKTVIEARARILALKILVAVYIIRSKIMK